VPPVWSDSLPIGDRYMARLPDIHKAAGVLILERKVLVVRALGENNFVLPGGKLDDGETAEAALERELAEELGILVASAACEELGVFYDEAAGGSGRWLQMSTWRLFVWGGTPVVRGEIAEMAWVDSATRGVAFGSIFCHQVLPLLVERDLVA
jgi:8-oxo-dGTP diphosphatase